MEKTEAGLNGLNIREITLKYTSLFPIMVANKTKTEKQTEQKLN